MNGIRITNGKAHVGVMRGNDKQRWWVLCGICKPGFSSLFGLSDGASSGGMLSVSNAIANAPTWEVAQAWAQIHAADHEVKRCATCQHLPVEKVSTPPNAHLKGRSAV